VTWSQILDSLLPLLGDSDAWISTLLDFYKFPRDFPGWRDVSSTDDPWEKVTKLQERFAMALSHRRRFIPFLALHEFEAWLFSSPETVATHFGRDSLAGSLHAAVRKAGKPELINHGADTHPKARLSDLKCGYKETSDGPMLLEKIGIETIRAACPHFNGWLNRLEALG
jgi:hypothetical protein